MEKKSQELEELIRKVMEVMEEIDKAKAQPEIYTEETIKDLEQAIEEAERKLLKTLYKSGAQKTGLIELTVTHDISVENLSKLLYSLNRLHANLSGKPLEIAAIRIGLPNLIYESSAEWGAE